MTQWKLDNYIYIFLPCVFTVACNEDILSVNKRFMYQILINIEEFPVGRKFNAHR